ncbi:uncharacterized protein LOC116295413 [Actinia tenebrosa]|uniref:Uncharacterized protein LOC116295413 n=1 Tax=Actinia tenebrosa TaxID=6105 RepID=A0A6P8HUM1_ACTTE|nr:uncharacterized protein LOC116295413 [Actinia tenebrosa]
MVRSSIYRVHLLVHMIKVSLCLPKKFRALTKLTHSPEDILADHCQLSPRKMVKEFVFFFRVLCVAVTFRSTSSEVLQVAVANKSLHRTPEFGFAYFVFQPNSKLEIEYPSQFHAPNYKPCALACARNMTCLSFNFGKKPLFLYQGQAQYLCELLPTDKYNSSSKYQSQNSDFDHYSIRSNCSKSPCLHNFTCIANYTEDTYECSCPRPAFEGKHCNDVDECTTGQHNCGPNATCTNIVGSYNCEITSCTYEKALGMESREIPDSSITASSSWGGGDSGNQARLNNNPAHWAPSSSRVGEWLQVDFGRLTLVTKVVTQGRPYSPEMYMTSYLLSYRRENENWTSYVHTSFGGTLPGNINYYGTVTNTLDPKITTRYIRIHPQTWHQDITIRVEFYGCYLS